MNTTDTEARPFFATGGAESNTEPTLEMFTAADAGKEIGCSTTTVKRLTHELRLPVLATKSGIYLYTRPMLTKIRVELERRQREAVRP